MRLQIRRVIRQQRVCRRVRLIKPIPRKLRHQIEDLLDLLRRIPVPGRPLHKSFPLRRHLLGLFLPHRAPQQIRIAQRISRQPVRHLHHLLLIHDDAQRLLQNFLQLRQLVFDLPPPMFALDKIVNHSALNRSRPVQRIQRRQVFNRIRLIPPQHISHPVRFELEHARRQSAMKYLPIRLFIFQRYLIQHHLLAFLRQQLQRVVQNRQRRQPEKIHLQEAHLLDRHHVERGHNFVVLRLVQRHQFDQWPRRNHHPRRMHARIPNQPFELPRRVHQLPHLPVFLVRLPQCHRLFQRIVQLDVQRRRHHLRNPVHVGVRHVHRASHIFNRRFRRHRPKRDDLRHILAPVFLRHIFDHFPAPVHAEIDVDIRHRNPLRIQKPLKQQLMLQRIDIRNSQRIRHQRARRRSPPRPHRNPLLPRMPDEVPHNQKISRKLHLLNNRNLARQSLLIVRQRMLQPPLLKQSPQALHPSRESLPRNVLEITVRRESLRYIEVRKRRRNFFQPQITALGNRHRARQYIRRVLEHAQHLVAVLHKKLVALKLHPVRVQNRLPHLDAQHHVLRVRVVLAQVVAVVRRHQRYAQVLLQLKQSRMDAVFHLQSLVLNLQKKILPPK